MKWLIIFFGTIFSYESFPQCVDCGPGSGIEFVKKETRSVAEIYIESIKKTYKPKVYDGVAEPKQLPNLEENRKTLLGIDSNKDGVRDDIEIYINRHFDQDYDREIFKKFSRRGTHYFKTGKQMTVEQLQNEIDGFMQDLECSRYIAEFGYMKKNEQVRDRTFNIYDLVFDTKLRDSFLGEDIRKLRSGSSGVGTGTQAFKYCPKNIRKKYPMKEKVK